MRILLTNDDGIDAPGLAALRDIVAEFAPDAEVWTVAPALEQSGVGHAITYNGPLRVMRRDERTFAVVGTPADCVITALHHVMPEAPDLVLSGVNRGNNSAENALYSGTLGAAIEGALQGVRSVALSAFLGPDNYAKELQFAAARAHGAEALRQIMAIWPDEDAAYKLFWNVNFPPRKAEDVKGVVLTAQGSRPQTRFFTEEQAAPGGKKVLWITGGNQQEPSGPGSDAAANLDGFISLTPMRADLTDHSLLSILREAQ